MRIWGIIISVFLVVVFLGGYVPLAGSPLFARIDRIAGTHLLMDIHYGVFFFIYPRDSSRSESRAAEDLKNFQERPLGIDNKSKYRDLDKASQH
jgi:hypothetical protein